MQIGFYSIFRLHPAYEVITAFLVVESTQKWPVTNIQSLEMPGLKISACVVNTSICHENSLVSQESSSSDVEMEVQSPQLYSSIYKSVTTFCATHAYVIY